MSRLKTVFKNPGDVAKLWASQSQPRAEYSYYGCSCGDGWTRCQCYRHGNGRAVYIGTREKIRALSFDGVRLFSYGAHYLMGTFLEFNGRKIAVLNSTKYSNATANQFGETLRAIQAAGIPYAYIDGGEEREKFDSHSTDTELVAAVREEIAASRARFKLQVERVENGCHHVYEVENTRENLDDFNARMLALGESAARIHVFENVWTNGLEHARRYEIARENHSQRRQLVLNLVSAKQLASMSARVVGSPELCKEPDYKYRSAKQRRTS